MKRLFLLLLRYSPMRVFWALAASVTAGLAGTAFVGLVNHVLDDDVNRSRFVVPAFLGLILLTPILRFTADYMLMHLAQTAVFDLRCKLSRLILGAPLRQLEKLGSNKLLATLTSDVSSIGGLLPDIPLMCSSAVVIAGMLGYLFWLHWQGAILFLVAGAIGVIFYNLIFRRGMRNYHLARERNDLLIKGFEGLLFGTKELKLHRDRRDAFLTNEIDGRASEVRTYNLRGQGWFVAASAIGETLFVGITACVLLVLPLVWPATDSMVLRGFVLSIMYILGPIQYLVAMGSRIGQGVVALNKIESLGLRLEKIGVETEAPPAAESTWSTIQYQELARAYHVEREERAFMLGPINVQLKPGELIFIIGGNGSGKTTLAKLLMGLYEPESGSILWDGKPVDDHNRDPFRQLFSGVFSDFFLFESFLGLGTPDLDEAAKDYLRRLHLDHKVRVENGRLSSVDLSQGQRKRLALLTAYLEDRPVYLFDEWASDQDPDFKDVFYKAILPELKARGKTVLAITHDDRYFHLADRVIKLDYGQIVEDGAPKGSEPS